MPIDAWLQRRCRWLVLVLSNFATCAEPHSVSVEIGSEAAVFNKNQLRDIFNL